MADSGSLPRQSYRDLGNAAPHPVGEARWLGRTGRGQDVAVYEAGAWVDVMYFEDDGTTARGGFSLNPLYTGQLATVLVELLAKRAEVAAGRADPPEDSVRLQEAVDRAHSALTSSAYVGGPSEREAWQTALQALGEVATQHQGESRGVE